MPNPLILPPASPASDILTDELVPDLYVLPTALPTSDILPDDVSDTEVNGTERLTKEEERESVKQITTTSSFPLLQRNFWRATMWDLRS